MNAASFTPAERSLLGAIADVLIPAADGFPSASEAGVAGTLMDQVLAARPDLADGLRTLLQNAAGQNPASFVAGLKTSAPDSFGVLAEFVPGAYFLNETVRGRLGYAGQTARALEPWDEAIDGALLRSVTNRGPIYRATPGAKAMT